MLDIVSDLGHLRFVDRLIESTGLDRDTCGIIDQYTREFPEFIYRPINSKSEIRFNNRVKNTSQGSRYTFVCNKNLIEILQYFREDDPRIIGFEWELSMEKLKPRKHFGYTEEGIRIGIGNPSYLRAPAFLPRSIDRGVLNTPIAQYIDQSAAHWNNEIINPRDGLYDHYPDNFSQLQTGDYVKMRVVCAECPINHFSKCHYYMNYGWCEKSPLFCNHKRFRIEFFLTRQDKETPLISFEVQPDDKRIYPFFTVPETSTIWGYIKPIRARKSLVSQKCSIL